MREIITFLEKIFLIIFQETLNSEIMKLLVLFFILFFFFLLQITIYGISSPPPPFSSTYYLKKTTIILNIYFIVILYVNYNQYLAFIFISVSALLKAKLYISFVQFLCSKKKIKITKIPTKTKIQFIVPKLKI